MFFFLDNAITYFIDYSVNNFYMHWETKKFVWLAFLLYLLYCGGLELNQKYL